MSRRTWKQWISHQFRADRRSTRPPRAQRVRTFETLAPRMTPAVSAFFSAGVLTVTGDGQGNTIEVSRNAAGNLLVNDGAVAIRRGTPTVANTRQIRVLGQGGNDTLTLNEANDDVLLGGPGIDVLDGGAGDNVLIQD